MKESFRLAFSIVSLGLLAACAAPAVAPTAVPAATNTPFAAPTATREPARRETRQSESSPTSPPFVPTVASTFPTAPPKQIVYVAGSSQKVCQLTGETDHETNKPTASQTVSRYGLFAGDLGYSFEHNGKLFFLLADVIPSPTFNDKPNAFTDTPRMPDDTDAIAYSTDATISQCIKLDFTTDSIGAFKDPVVLNAQGKPAITLRTDEIPISGISDAGKMYVIFGTDNYVYPTPGPAKGHLGFGTRSVIGVSDDDANTFHYLYDFSKPPDAKFINVAIASAADGYLYFWGTQGGELWRHGPPFLARKLVGSMGSPKGIEYLHAVDPNGKPVFLPNESDAIPLFHDSLPDAKGAPKEADCMGELGVEWNPFVKEWVMLYNCSNHTPANPNGIYMRTADEPWGPWSAPQTIFNSIRDGGECKFIYHPVTPDYTTACPNIGNPGRLDEQGGVYGPYFLSRFTTGDVAKETSTFYYTLATWNPYGQVIMKTTIQGPP